MNKYHILVYLQLSLVLSVQFDFKHVSLILGPTQSGKDTLLYNFDQTLYYKEILQFGDGMHSCTKNFTIFEYYNQYLAPNKQKYAINSVGFGDTKGDMSDEDIAKFLLYWAVNSLYSINGRIEVIYFVQSLNQPFNIEKVLIIMKLAFGDAIVENSIIIATHGNAFGKNYSVNNMKAYKNKMDSLNKIAKDYRIKGGVFDFRGIYKSGDGEDETSVEIDASLGNKKYSIEELAKITNELKPFNLTNLAKEILNEIKAIQAQLQSNMPKKIIKTYEYVEKYRYKRYWYTLWLFDHQEYYTDEIIKEIEATDLVTQDEAFNELLKKRIGNSKMDINDIKEKLKSSGL